MAIHADVLARLDERAARQVAAQLETQFAEAGRRSGAAYATQLQAGMDAATRVGTAISDTFARHGQVAGRGFSSAFGGELARTLPIASGFTSAMAGYESAAAKAGVLAGRAMGMAFTAAAGGLIGAAGYTLFKGFERYEALDAATHRLQNLSSTMQATGQAGLNVAQVMKTVNDVVEGTPIALNQAMSAVTVALGSGIRQGDELKRYLTDIADAAGYSGRSFDELALVFSQVQAKGRLMGEETLQFMEKNIPVAAWMQQTFKLTAEQYEEMQRKGQISLRAVQMAIEQHAGGMSKAMGQTVRGSIENVTTAIGRLGANFLGAIFGKPTEDANQLVDVLKTVQERIDDLGKWVTEHQNDIREFFRNAGDVAADLARVLGGIGKTLGEHKELIYGVVIAYGAWKTIEGISAVITGLQTIDTLLKGIPPAAATAGAAMGGMGAAGARGGGGKGGGGGPGLFGLIPPVAEVWGTAAAGNWIANQIQGTDHSIWWPIQQGLSMPGKWWGQIAGGTKPSSSPLGSNALTPGFFLPGSAPGDVSSPPPFTPGPGQPTYVWDWAKGGYVATGGASSSGGLDNSNPFLPPRDDKKGPRLPHAPVVPFDTSIPAGIPGMPETAATYSAETSLLESRHRLAEKRARLNQLEHTATATAEDILDARNDVLSAQRSAQEAEMRLNEARLNEFEKYTKQMRQGADILGDIGAQLDQDLGISKGLAGLAENLTKFVASLAAAPVIGALSGVQAGLGFSPGTFKGTGFMGMLAAGGAFGPQHQPLPFGGSGYGGFTAGGIPGGIGLPGLTGASYGIPSGANIYSGPHTSDTHGALTPRAAALRSLLGQFFGVTDIGGYRSPDGFNEHSSGEALDIMVGGNRELGDQINQYLQANADALGLQYTLWQQQQWTPGQGPTPMADRGSGTQNHLDHVHARVLPGPLGGGQGGSVGPSGWGMPATGGGWFGGPGPGLGGASGDSPIPGAPGTPGVPFPGTEPSLIPGGGGPGLPGSGRGPGTALRGRYPGQGLNVPKSDGIGFDGGLIGLGESAIPTAISAAAGAAGAAGSAAAPGSGAAAGAAGAIISAAAQIGIDEINRAIGFGAQAAGILAGGLMETFVPNESPLADVSGGWIGRIAGAVAGVAPQIPNVAGQLGQAISSATGGQGLPAGLTPEDVAGQPDQRGAGKDWQPGNADRTINNNVTINGANIPNDDSMGNTVSQHLGAMYQR